MKLLELEASLNPRALEGENEEKERRNKEVGGGRWAMAAAWEPGREKKEIGL